MDKQKNPASLFLVLLAVALVFFLLDKQGITSNVRAGFEQLFSIVSGEAHKVTLSSPVVENDKSADEKLLLLDKLEKENEDLKLQLGILETKQHLLLGKVLSSSRFFIIDIGTDDGVRQNHTAVFKNTYVGKISKVSVKTSRVLLPTEKDSIVKVQTKEAGAVGLLRGTGDGAYLSEVLLSDKLQEGDVLVTVGDVDEDGLGVRPGLAIGKISQIRKSSDEFSQEATVELLMDYKNLANVFVIL